MPRKLTRWIVDFTFETEIYKSDSKDDKTIVNDLMHHLFEECDSARIYFDQRLDFGRVVHNLYYIRVRVQIPHGDLEDSLEEIDNIAAGELFKSKETYATTIEGVWT